jgi:hypothetical protein
MDTTENPIPFDETDDVEAHGLKEVAAGIGAAALLGGAGAGAALAATSTPANHGPSHTIVQSARHTEDAASTVLKRKTPTPPPDATTDSSRDQARTPAPTPLLKKLKGPRVTSPEFNVPVGQNLNQAVAKAKTAGQQTVKGAEDAVSKRLHKATPVPPIR